MSADVIDSVVRNATAHTRYGRLLDLVALHTDEVDFREIAETLAHIERYAGAGAIQISVAQHTLIAFEAIRDLNEAAAPYVLLHDAHEYLLGDITQPAERALRIAADLVADNGGQVIAQAIRMVKSTLDWQIWKAAGLRSPSPEIERLVKRADLVALATERRDFLAPPQYDDAWPSLVNVQPLARRFSYMTPYEAAEHLFSRFCEHLPALSILPPQRLRSPILERP